MLIRADMEMNREQRLSKNFALGEFLVDTTFPELAQKLAPDDRALDNLKRLTNVIDRIVDKFPTDWTIRSGFRDDQLNEACRNAGLPASIESLHLYGCAADIEPNHEDVDLEAVFEWINEQSRKDLPIHEAVYYPLKGFIHVAVQSPELPTPKRILMRT